MKHAAALLGAALATALSAGQAGAQIVPNLTPFAVEVRGGIALPRGDWEDIASRGTTVGGSVTYHAVPLLGFYAGYDRTTFGPSDDFEEFGGDGDLVVSGLAAGVRLGIPTPLIPIDPWIRAGAVYYSFDASGFDDPEAEFESDSSLGFEVGAGVGVNILPKIQLTPGVTYTNFRFEADGGEDDKVDVHHVKVDIGVRVRI